MHLQYAIQVLQRKVTEIEYTLGCLNEVSFEDFEAIQCKKQELLRAIEHLSLLDITYGGTDKACLVSTTKND